MVFPDGPNSALVIWDIPQPVGQTIGYHIYYTSSTSAGNVTTDDVFFNNHIVTGLVNGETYTFSVAGRSRHFESEPVMEMYGSISLRKSLSHTPCLCVANSLFLEFHVLIIIHTSALCAHSTRSSRVVSGVHHS